MDYFSVTDPSYIKDSIASYINGKVARGLRRAVSSELNMVLPQALINLVETKMRKYIYTRVKRRGRKEWDDKSTPHLGESILTTHRIINQYATKYGFWSFAPHAPTHIGELGSVATIMVKRRKFMRFKDRDNLEDGWKFAKIVHVPRRISEVALQEMFVNEIATQTDRVVASVAERFK